MKMTIKSNGKIYAVSVEKMTDCTEPDHFVKTESVQGFEIDFDPASIYSDFEFWLEDDNGKLVDYARMNVSKRNKMKFNKG